MSDEMNVETTEEAATEEAATEEPKTRMAKKVTGISKDAALTVSVDANPKRPGSASYDRFEGYLTDPAPATVQEALDHGLTMGDIKYDSVHGSIEVEGAVIEEYEVVVRGKRKAKSEDGEEADADAVGTGEDSLDTTTETSEDVFA